MPVSAKRSVYAMLRYCFPRIGVVHEPAAWATLVDSLLQSVEHEAGLHRFRHAPADDLARKNIDDEGHIDEALPGRDIGAIRDPQSVRCRGLEVAIDAIERARRGFVWKRGAVRLAADDAFEPHRFHQPRHRAERDIEALAQHMTPHLPNPHTLGNSHRRSAESPAAGRHRL
jgi:hypothetical protein